MNYRSGRLVSRFGCTNTSRTLLDFYKFIKHRILDYLPKLLVKVILKLDVFASVKWLVKNCSDENDEDRTYTQDGSSSDPDLKLKGLQSDAKSEILSEMSDRSNVTRSVDSVRSGLDDLIDNIIVPHDF